MKGKWIFTVFLDYKYSTWCWTEGAMFLKRFKDIYVPLETAENQAFSSGPHKFCKITDLINKPFYVSVRNLEGISKVKQ